jgi:hypothetical protein
MLHRRKSLLGSSNIAVVVYSSPRNWKRSPTAPPTWDAVMKYFGATGVPRYGPQVPWYCQPLLVRLPVGAVVLWVGSPVEQNKIAEAGRGNASQKIMQTLSFDAFTIIFHQ